MTVKEMLTRMSSEEISEWIAYYKIKASEQPNSGGANARTAVPTREGVQVID